MKRQLGQLASIGLALLVSTGAMANPERWQLNMTPGVTATSQSVYHLHMLTLWICVVIGVIVFGAMFYSIFKHRKDKGYKPATFTVPGGSASLTYNVSLESEAQALDDVVIEGRRMGRPAPQHLAPAARRSGGVGATRQPEAAVAGRRRLTPSTPGGQ